jgi:hypothetical protein
LSWRRNGYFGAMSPQAPSIDDLLKSYRRALLARVSPSECAGWRGTFSPVFRTRIAEREQREAAFIAAEIERRRAG